MYPCDPIKCPLCIVTNMYENCAEDPQCDPITCPQCMVTTYDNCAEDPQCDPATCPMCMVTGDDPCIDDPDCNNTISTIPEPCQDDPEGCNNETPVELESQILAKPSLVLQSASTNSKEGFIVGAKKSYKKGHLFMGAEAIIHVLVALLVGQLWWKDHYINDALNPWYGYAW